MKKYYKIILSVVLAASLLLGGLALSSGAVTFASASGINGDTVTISREEYDRLQRYSKMDEILQYVQDHYYVEPDVNAMIDGATRGLLYGLKDQYTFYYSPDEWSDMWKDDEGEYAGIGVQMLGSNTDYMVTITRVFKDSPAETAGLKKGDVFYMVEDIEVTSYTMQNAVNIMRGTPGESVHVEVYRGDELLSFDIVRAVIKVNRVEYSMLAGNVGYIALYDFAGDCADAFTKALNQLTEQGAVSLIVDLRDNGGGWVRDSIAIADLFLDKQLLFYTADKLGNQEKTYLTDGKSDIPLVLLVNENSASSSEILTGAMKDYKRATVVGVNTFGKGIIQNLVPLDENNDNNTAGFQLTIAQYFTPLGNKVHGVGIAPDILAEMPEDLKNHLYQLGDLSDPQLKAAYDAALALSPGQP
jgi:carboxyl-terminal processing protease